MKVVFTGGGTAGHVIPNIPLIEHFQQLGWQVSYIGSGVPEAELIAATGVPFQAIPTGKLRRYWSWKNLLDVVRLAAGIWKAFWLMRGAHAQVVFSKGGYVAFPVVVGAWLNRVPVVAHESDLSPGLANRLSLPFVDVVCTSFAETRLGSGPRCEHTGSPMRESLLAGSAARGLEFCAFPEPRPVVVVVGGSLGAEAINVAVRDALVQLDEQFNVVHVCGPGHVEPDLQGPGYHQFEYLDAQWADVLAAADLIVSRAGANAVFELAALGKPNLLIPLSAKASRGDQIENARYAERQGWSRVLGEETLTAERLVTELISLSKARLPNRPTVAPRDATGRIARIIETVARKESVARQ